MSPVHVFKSILPWIILLGFLLGTPSNGVSQVSKGKEEKECDGPFKGKEPTPKQLKEVLKKHREWTESEGQKGEQANLCGAFLPQANLQGAFLAGARLQQANLSKSNLQGANLSRTHLERVGYIGVFSADLSGADLSGARLMGANLERAILNDATLSNSDLSLANLEGAWLLRAELFGANLSGADLSGAYLQGANLRNANLSGADLGTGEYQGGDFQEHFFEWSITLNVMKPEGQAANLRGANLRSSKLVGANLLGTDMNEVRADWADFRDSRFEPSSVEHLTLLGATGLSRIFFMNPEPVGQLRSLVRALGLRVQERALTSALRKYQLREHPGKKILEGFFLGGYLTDFGASPGISIICMFYLIVIFAFVYIGPLSGRNKKAGIWQVWDPDRIHQDEGTNKPVQLKLERGMRLVWTALYFSFLSAFRIGWRELNVGNWLSRIQPHEYTLRATGWVRVVSGLQSLLSVYFLALWALTYFGRPFE